MVWRTYLFDNSYHLKQCQKNCCEKVSLTPKTPKSESPYYPDREHSQRHEIAGTAKERQWKDSDGENISQVKTLKLQANKLLNII